MKPSKEEVITQYIEKEYGRFEKVFKNIDQNILKIENELTRLTLDFENLDRNFNDKLCMYHMIHKKQVYLIGILLAFSMIIPFILNVSSRLII